MKNVFSLANLFGFNIGRMDKVMTLKHRGNISLVAIAFILIFSSSSFAEIIQYIYNDARQLTGVIYGDGTVVEYMYDASGNRIVKSITFACSPTNPNLFSPYLKPVQNPK